MQPAVIFALLSMALAGTADWKLLSDTVSTTGGIRQAIFWRPILAGQTLGASVFRFSSAVSAAGVVQVIVGASGTVPATGAFGASYSASAVKAAPARNVPLGPAKSHSAPATMLAASMATPLTRL